MVSYAHLFSGLVTIEQKSAFKKLCEGWELKSVIRTVLPEWIPSRKNLIAAPGSDFGFSLFGLKVSE